MKISVLHVKGKAHWQNALCCIITFAVIFVAASSAVQAAGIHQKVFSSPEEAINGLVAAIRANDTKAMRAILGPSSKGLIYSGDAVADKASREKFLRAYDQKNELKEEREGKWVLYIGEDNWPLPIPIEKKGSEWLFNAKEAKKEILNRRIGRNELRVMDVLHAYSVAQHEYASKNCSGSGMVEFAQSLVSTKGKHDGLYWDTKEGEEESPLGPLVARAAKEGYSDEDLSPFHGYYFRILKGQGTHAQGGAYSYVVKGKMILGFALVAYPAKYGNSGVMTFIVNQEGVIYEKNLDGDTKREAEAMELFDPDETWKKVEERAEK